MPTLDLSNAQNLMYLGAVVEDTKSCTEQPVNTSEQIAEAQQQEISGVVLFITMALILAFFVGFYDKRN